ncbi:MAG: HAMP domain-containing protein [Fusobacteriaceae bacterium]|nr:HAMP domain-containing protein [Fusobacteriaceae bacterium]
MNIRNKFVIPTLLVSIVTFSIWAIYMVNDENKKMIEQFDKKRIQLKTLAALVNVESLWNFDYKGVEVNTKAFLDDEDIVRIEVRDVSGEKIYGEFKEHNIQDIVIEKSEIKKENEKIGEIEIHFSKKRINDTISKSTVRIVVVNIVLALLIGITIIIVSFVVTKPIKNIQEYSKKLKEGDFSNKITITSKDEIGDTARLIEETISRINDVLLDIDEGQQAIRRSANDISIATETLAQKTSEQAESLQETTSTVEQITSIIALNVEKTKEVNKLTQDTSYKIKETGEDSKKLEIAMTDIIESSKAIDNMINIIDDIAFQTNLLALNAAVEAARAGEQNRGFAVIAEEIRNLAKTSSTAAKEIKEKIKESEVKIGEGSKYIKQTLSNMTLVISDVEEIASVMADITLSVTEEEKGIDHIREAIFELDNITQHNASIAEETSAITNELRTEANKLSSIFRFFKLKEEK